MKELFIDRSTNGRSGLSVVGDVDEIVFPARGSLEYIGCVSGIEVFKFIQDEKQNTWVLPFSGHGVHVHGGATLVKEMYLQSENYASLLLLGQKSVVEIYGYKRRGSNIKVFIEGKEVHVPTSVLAAMGLVEVENKVMVIEQPSALSTTMAQAFSKLK